MLFGTSISSILVIMPHFANRLSAPFCTMSPSPNTL